ncbi:MAG: glycoside hydrolase family 28 protein [Spirochaetales bacterium]|nr:glycoside hydrolase family 28 protein [Candidatus Physcosoma equi]
MDITTILNYGGKGDGVTDNTLAFSLAFASENATVVVPAGVYLTGPITLLSNSTLILEKGAVLRFSNDESLYEPVWSRWEGVRTWCMHPCLYAEKAENVTVKGEGTIEGNGEAWWNHARENKKNNARPTTPVELKFASLNPEYMSQPSGGGGRYSQYLRPSLVQFNNCRNVRIEGVTVQNSPFWTIHPVFCTGLEIIGIKINNPSDSPNTDAIDIDSCKCVTIKDCDISVGDDGITLKSGTGEDGVAVGIPTSEVLVENCTVRSAHGGAVIGSETAAGINNVTVRDCNFINTDRGIRIKTRRGRGGLIENLKFSNINVSGCLCPVAINMYYRCGAMEDWMFSLNKMPITEVTPCIRNIEIENMKATECRSSAGFVVGLPEVPITNITMKDCDFQVGGELVSTDLSEMFNGLEHVEERGIRQENATLRLENVKVSLA